MNYACTEATIAADQVQLYKLIARQVAAQMDLTASFLPKPVANVNGNGCHTNISIAKAGRTSFTTKRAAAGFPTSPGPSSTESWRAPTIFASS